MCRVTEKEQITISPWIDNQSNTINSAEHTRTVKIPDVCPAELIGRTSAPEFSMAAGEFLDVYASQENTWACIITCFFIDAAPNVIEYIEAIHGMLKPGGVWINFGPLTYHWQANVGNDDDRYRVAIEYSLEQIHHIIKSFGFEYLRNEMRESTYSCNIKSMMKTVYNCSFFTVIKR